MNSRTSLLYSDLYTPFVVFNFSSFMNKSAPDSLLQRPHEAHQRDLERNNPDLDFFEDQYRDALQLLTTSRCQKTFEVSLTVLQNWTAR